MLLKFESRCRTGKEREGKKRKGREGKEWKGREEKERKGTEGKERKGKGKEREGKSLIHPTYPTLRKGKERKRKGREQFNPPNPTQPRKETNKLDTTSLLSSIIIIISLHEVGTMVGVGEEGAKLIH